LKSTNLDLDEALKYFMELYQDNDADTEEDTMSEFMDEFSDCVEEEVRAEIAQGFLCKFNLPPEVVQRLVDENIEDLDMCE